MPEQQELEQAIANVDKVLSAFQCDRPSRNILEVGWRLIVVHARGDAHPQAGESGKRDGQFGNSDQDVGVHP